MRGTKTRIWLRSLLGVALILGLPTILVYALRTAYQSSPDPGSVDRSVFDYAKPGEATKPDAVTPPGSLPAEPTAGSTRVYECTQNGQPMYSSQPCGSDSVARDINTQAVNTSKPPDHDGCVDAQQEIEQIDARMHQPYTKAEGKYYGERLSKLSTRLRELKCRWP